MCSAKFNGKNGKLTHKNVFARLNFREVAFVREKRAWPSETVYDVESESICDQNVVLMFFLVNA